MITFILGFMFIVFDLTMGSSKITINVIPDYVGYGLILFGIYKMRKEVKKNDAFEIASKQFMLTAGVLLVLSYIICVFDMLGISYKAGTFFVLFENIAADIMYMFALFMFLQMLVALQGQKLHFQIKSLNIIMVLIGICLMCQNIATSLGVSEMTMTFAIFEKVLDVMLFVYIYTSGKTYKEKYLNNM